MKWKTLLPDGKVLLAGGGHSNGALASVEVDDPAGAVGSRRPDSRCRWEVRIRHIVSSMVERKVVGMAAETAGCAESSTPL
jgi:hypothetical protein